MIGQFDTMTTLWHTACRRVLFSPREKLDRWTGLTTIVYDNFLAAKSMEFDFDVGRDLWLTKARFPKLQRDYLDFDEVGPFFQRCEKIANDSARRGVITQMHCRKPVKKSGFSSGEGQHSWGGCMLAFTYHGGKRWNQPTISLHSRVSYIGYLGPMDMAVAWVLAREIGRRTDTPIEDFAFRWYIDSLQWHGMKSVPYVIAHDLRDRVMDEDRYPTRGYPTIGATRRSINSLHNKHEAGLSLERTENPFGPVRRLRKRYHDYMTGNPLPSIPLDQLQLLPWKENQ